MVGFVATPAVTVVAGAAGVVIVPCSSAVTVTVYKSSV